MEKLSFENLKTKELSASDLNRSKGGVKIPSGIIKFGKRLMNKAVKGWNALKRKGGKGGPLLEPFAGDL